jgi:hypothetical protein
MVERFGWCCKRDGASESKPRNAMGADQESDGRGHHTIGDRGVWNQATEAAFLSAA